MYRDEIAVGMQVRVPHWPLALGRMVWTVRSVGEWGATLYRDYGADWPGGGPRGQEALAPHWALVQVEPARSETA